MISFTLIFMKQVQTKSSCVAAYFNFSDIFEYVGNYRVSTFLSHDDFRYYTSSTKDKKLTKANQSSTRFNKVTHMLIIYFTTNLMN